MRPPEGEPSRDKIVYRVRMAGSPAFVAALDGGPRFSVVQAAAGMDLLTVLAFFAMEDRLETPASSVRSAQKV